MKHGQKAGGSRPAAAPAVPENKSFIVSDSWPGRGEDFGHTVYADERLPHGTRLYLAPQAPAPMLAMDKLRALQEYTTLFVRKETDTFDARQIQAELAAIIREMQP